MRRLLALSCVALLLPAATQARDPDDFPLAPPQGWSQSDCAGQMRVREAAATKEAEALMAKAGPVPTPTDKHKQEAAVAARLAELQKTAKARITAQKKAAGGWARGPVWASVNWAGKRYEVAGCLVTKPDIPLRTMVAVASAAETPTKEDVDLLATANKLIGIKTARDRCAERPTHLEKVKCRDPYRDYRWLDRYRMK